VAAALRRSRFPEELATAGLFQIVGSVALALPGWGWQLADGIITLALGVLVLAQ
jgi:uncharacterized membrane protein HdeD (DUF308 family)